MKKEKVAVVFIHGFMGRAKQFDSIKQRLSDSGADLYSPVLPGHETSLEEFLKTNGDTWQKGISDTVDSLKHKYDRIILVGHSMGGLIAMREAARDAIKIGRVIAIGFPIKVSVGPQWIKTNMAASRPFKEGEDERVTVARNMGGVKISGIGDYLRTLPNNLQFLKVAKDSRGKLGQLNVALTVINFKKDEIVGKTAKDFVIKTKPETEFYLLENSYHFMFTPEETDFMASIIRREIGNT